MAQFFFFLSPSYIKVEFNSAFEKKMTVSKSRSTASSQESHSAGNMKLVDTLK